MNKKNVALIWFIAISVYITFCPHKVMADYKSSARLVAHAFGGYNDTTYTNSREAFLHNYNEGHRVFEVDFQFTDDNILATIHDRSGGKIYSFKKEQQNSSYTIMTFEDVCHLMVEYPDIYIITDTKYFEDSEATLKTFDYMTNAISSIDSTLMQRITVQFYNQAMYRLINDRYDFESYIYTLYSSPDTNAQVIDFIEESGITTVTMWANRATPSFVKSLNELGTYVFVHTVNNLEYANSLFARGVHGIYTDFLYPSDLELSGADLNKRYFYDYIKGLNESSSTYVIYLSGKDVATLPSNIQQALEDLGITLPKNTDDICISILDNKKLVLTQVATNELKSQYTSNETLLSTAYNINDGQYSLNLSADGLTYEVDKKGITIFTYNTLSKSLVDCSTFSIENEFSRDKTDFSLIIRHKYLLDYLGSLKNENYIAVLSVADEASSAIDDTIQQKLTSLGLNQILQGKYWHSYAAIIDGSNVIYEKLSKSKISYTTKINNHQISVASAGYTSGNYSSIMLNGAEYSLNSRGINIVIFDKATGEKISSVCFDTYEGLRCIQ